MANKVVDEVLLRLQSTLSTLKLRSVDLTPKREKKQKLEDDDDYTVDTAEAFKVVERTNKSARLAGQESPEAQACRESLRSATRRTKDESSRGLGEGSSSKTK